MCGTHQPTSELSLWPRNRPEICPNQYSRQPPDMISFTLFLV